MAKVTKPNTRILMTASAAFMALVGLSVAVFPHEILRYFGAPIEGFPVALMKIVAGLYFGFAILNWMARGNLMGGIYSRPVGIANLVHFGAIALVLLKRLPGAPAPTEYGLIAGTNAIFATAFGFVVFAAGPCGDSCG